MTALREPDDEPQDVALPAPEPVEVPDPWRYVPLALMVLCFGVFVWTAVRVALPRLRSGERCVEWREYPVEFTDAVPRRECVRWEQRP